MMTADEQEIRALVAEWARASEAGDFAAIDALMDEDILFFTAGREPFGRDAFRHHFESNVKSMTITVSADVREVSVSGDQAYVHTALNVRIQPEGGDPITRTGYALSVYRRRPGGRWKLWRDANLC
jgi:uncharacterized protein (TIGR02246 family)